MSRQYTASLYILVPTHNVYHPQGSVYKVSIGNESTARVNGSSGVKQDTGFPMTGNNVIKIQLLVLSRRVITSHATLTTTISAHGSR